MRLGTLPRSISKILGDGPDAVFYSAQTWQKIAVKHPDVDEDILSHVGSFTEHRYFEDIRSQTPSVIGLVEAGSLFKIAIKRTKRRELLITTIHRTNQRQVRSILKKYPEIKLAQ